MAEFLSSRLKNLKVGIEGYTDNTRVGEIIGDVEVKGDVNAESLKVNSNEVWHTGNKPSLGDLANIDDTNKVDQSVVVFSAAQSKYMVNDVNTIITITDGGNF